MTAFASNQFDLQALADDGCPHHEPAAGWQSTDFVPQPDGARFELFAGVAVREVAPDLFKREGAPIVIWSVEDCAGFTLLLVCIDKR